MRKSEQNRAILVAGTVGHQNSVASSKFTELRAEIDEFWMDLIYLTDPICCCESECGPRQPIACSATIARSYLLSYHPQMLFHTHHTQLFWNDPFQKRSFLFHTEYFRMRFIDSLSIVRIHFHSKYLFQSWECLKRACNANDRRM